MLSRYILCALCAVSGVLSRAVPDVAQAPLLEAAQHDAKPQHLVVMIAYRRSGEEHEATFSVPLRVPLQGSMLQGHWGEAEKAIEAMKILSVVDMETKISVSLEELSRIKCRVEPEFSVEEVRAATASGVELGVWPHFGIEDETVRFDRSESRWFMAGRLIKNVECW